MHRQMKEHQGNGREMRGLARQRRRLAILKPIKVASQGVGSRGRPRAALWRPGGRRVVISAMRAGCQLLLRFGAAATSL